MYKLNPMGPDVIMPILMRELSPKIHKMGNASLMECVALLNDVQAYFIELKRGENGPYMAREDVYLSLLAKYELSWILDTDKMLEYSKDFLSRKGIKEVSWEINGGTITHWEGPDEIFASPEESLLIGALLSVS